LALAKKLDIRRNLVVPNVYWGFFKRREADLLVITKAKYCYEIEIKNSFQDFKREFDKQPLPADRFANDDRLKKKIFVLPRHIYKRHAEEMLDLLPAYAGLWTLDGRGHWEEVVRPPNKKKARKLTETEYLQLLRLAYLRTWSLKRKIAVDARNA